jgi:thioredoxin-dependent peroxiredoxin
MSITFTYASKTFHLRKWSRFKGLPCLEFAGLRGDGPAVTSRMVRMLILFLATFSLVAFTASADPLEVGADAPTVTAPDQDGKPVAFADVYAKGVTLVYFYPKAGTSGCTAEACSLRDSYDKLHTQGLQIIGVSRDTGEAQKHFLTEYKLPFTLIADVDGRVAQAFGVPMMLGGLIPAAERQSFIVKHNKIVWTSLHAQTKGSAEEIQKALDDLK